jgi:hypothetical protein
MTMPFSFVVGVIVGHEMTISKNFLRFSKNLSITEQFAIPSRKSADQDLSTGLGRGECP